MSNGTANCLLEVCCPPNAATVASPDAVKALAKQMVADGCPREEAERYAAWMLKHFDLAERGTLQLFKASIVRVWQEKDPH